MRVIVQICLVLIERLKATRKWAFVTSPKSDISVPKVFAVNDLSSALTCIIIWLAP